VNYLDQMTVDSEIPPIKARRNSSSDSDSDMSMISLSYDKSPLL